MLDFTRYPDLASRSLAGSVIGANDELFAPRQNLIMPGKAVHAPEAFGHTGKVYDGWETRRRREPAATGRSPPRGGGNRARGGDRHGVLPGQRPAVRLGRGDRRRGLPEIEELTTRTGRRWWTSRRRGETTRTAPGRRAASLDPRPVDDLPRRRGREVPRARRGGAGPRASSPAPSTWLALENGGRCRTYVRRFYSSPGNLILPGSGPEDG